MDTFTKKMDLRHFGDVVVFTVNCICGHVYKQDSILGMFVAFYNNNNNNMNNNNNNNNNKKNNNINNVYNNNNNNNNNNNHDGNNNNDNNYDYDGGGAVVEAPAVHVLFHPWVQERIALSLLPGLCAALECEPRVA